MSKLKKIVKYLLLGALLLIVAMVAGGYYFLNTTNGLKQAIKLINDHSVYQVSTDTVEGNLLSETILRNLHIKGPHLDFKTQQLVLAWKPKMLWDKKLIIKRMSVDNTSVMLSPDKQKKALKNDSVLSLKEIDLPIDIHVDEVEVNQLVIKNPVTQKSADNNAGDLLIDKIKLKVNYQKQKAIIDSLVFQGLDTQLKLMGEVQTKDNFPIHLQNQTDYTHQSYGKQQLIAVVDGNLKEKLLVQVDGSGLAEFSLNAQLLNLFDKPNLAVDLNLQRINNGALGLDSSSLSAQLKIKAQVDGKLDAQSKLNMLYDSPATDAMQLLLDGHVDGEKADADIHLNLLKSQQQLAGRANYVLQDKRLDIHVNSEALAWPQQSEKTGLSLQDVLLKVTGTLDDYALKFTGRSQSSALGQADLSVEGRGNLESLSDIKALLRLNKQPLMIKGRAAWKPKVAYQLSADAKHIKPFKQIPGIKDLNIQVRGDEANYQLDGHSFVYAKTIPPTDVKLTVSGDKQQLKKAALGLALLKGEVNINAGGKLSPLDVTAVIDAKHLKPQAFYQNVRGDISQQTQLAVKQIDGQLQVMAEIKQLMGQLQGRPLSGQGKIFYQASDSRLAIDELTLNLAGNQLHANGILGLFETHQSDLKAMIDAPDLHRLLPDLAGKINADIAFSGKANSPKIQADIAAVNLAYQQNKLGRLKVLADVDVAADQLKVLANAAAISNGEKMINQLKAELKGKLTAHQLMANLSSANTKRLPDIQWLAAGSLDKEAMRWQGSVQKIHLNHDDLGNWQLKTPAKLSLSKDSIHLSPLCLMQQKSHLCADANVQAGSGNVNLALNELPTKRFAALLPENIAIDTRLSAKANLKLADKKRNLQANLSANGGSLSLGAGKNLLQSKIKAFKTIVNLKNNQLQAKLKSDFSQLGAINATANIDDISQKKLAATVEIDNPSLSFISQLVPQLSHVSGHLTGKMAISGNLENNLNMAGNIHLHKTDFDVAQYGTQIRNLSLEIFAKEGNHLGIKGSANAGQGDLHVDGDIDIKNQKGQIKIKGNRFQVANARKLAVALSPDMQIVLDDTLKVRGQLLIPQALIVPESTSSKVGVSKDIVLPKQQAKKKTSSPVDVEMRVVLGDDVRVASADIETRLSGGIKINAKPGKAPKASGAIEVQTGELRIYGQMLNIERGRVIFSNGPIDNPSLDIRTSREIQEEEIVVGANVLGSVKHPEISLFSTPSMADASIISYLLFGRPPSADAFGTAAILQTGGLVGANTMARDIRSQTGLDVLDFTFTGLEAGKNLSKKLYAGMKSNFFDAINTLLLTYKINTKLRVQGSASDEMAIDLIKVIETD